MGYSIFIPFETETQLDKMHAFLTANFRPLATIVPNVAKQMAPEESTAPYRDLTYSGDYCEPMLGYDYGAGDTDIERGYRFAICYWMAIHGGRSRNEKAVMIYDGCDEWSICNNGFACPCSATLHTDNIGYRKIQPLMLAERMAEKRLNKWLTKEMLSELEAVDMAVQQELIRLSGLWQKNA